MPTMMQAALTYVAEGLPVFPLCFPTLLGNCGCGRKHQGKNIGKVPLLEHGLLDATTIIDTVLEWWSKWPEANIGIAIPKGYFVLDIDIMHNGYDSLGKLQEKYDAIPKTWLITTGTGGSHYWYKTDKEIRNTVKLDGLEGLDIRGVGGYVVTTPSMHRCGLRYEVSPVWDGEITPAPEWLIQLCCKPPIPAQTYQNRPAFTVTASEGARNDTLIRDAGAMRRRGLSEEAILSALLITNRDKCIPPLPDDEVRTIAKSIARYPPEITNRQSKIRTIGL